MDRRIGDLKNYQSKADNLAMVRAMRDTIADIDRLMEFVATFEQEIDKETVNIADPVAAGALISQSDKDRLAFYEARLQQHLQMLRTHAQATQTRTSPMHGEVIHSLDPLQHLQDTIDEL